jgi:hypothetical protein
MADGRINKTVRMRPDQVESLERMMDDETTFSALVRKAVDELVCRSRVSEEAPDYKAEPASHARKRHHRLKK